MKKFYSFLLMMLSICTTTYADNWMQYLPDNAYVVDVSIPGTHDSGTGYDFEAYLIIPGSTVANYARTQSLKLEDQWNLGVRAFDLRPKVTGSGNNRKLVVGHGIATTKLGFDDAIKQLCGFLEQNPTEFIVVHMLAADAIDDTFRTLLKTLLESDGVKEHLIDFNRNLTVGDMRGKMLIISRDPYDSTPYTGGFFNGWGNGVYRGISISGKSGPSASLNVQDISDVYQKDNEKKAAIIDLLNNSTKHVATKDEEVVWAFNLASGYNNEPAKISIPFVTTIEIGSTAAGYKANAQNTHPVFIDYLKENPAGPTGVVLMDYVAESDGAQGTELINTLIDNNYRYLPKINDEGKTISVPYYTYKTTGWTSTTGNTFQVNTWSTEGITDGSGMITPFFENWLNKGGRLGNGEIYYTLSECKKGYYKVSI